MLGIDAIADAHGLELIGGQRIPRYGIGRRGDIEDGGPRIVRGDECHSVSLRIVDKGLGAADPQYSRRLVYKIIADGDAPPACLVVYAARDRLCRALPLPPQDAVEILGSGDVGRLIGYPCNFAVAGVDQAGERVRAAGNVNLRDLRMRNGIPVGAHIVEGGNSPCYRPEGQRIITADPGASHLDIEPGFCDLPPAAHKVDKFQIMARLDISPHPSRPADAWHLTAAYVDDRDRGLDNRERSGRGCVVQRHLDWAGLADQARNCEVIYNTLIGFYIDIMLQHTVSCVPHIRFSNDIALQCIVA